MRGPLPNAYQDVVRWPPAETDAEHVVRLPLSIHRAP